MKTRKRSLALAAFLAVVSLAAAACGGDDDTTSSDSTETTAAAAEGGTDTTAAESEGGTEAEGGTASGTINISGSSTVEPVLSRAAELFEDIEPGVTINVDGPGTGDGFKLFCAGETDISNASRAIKDEEAADCKAAGVEFIELKIAFDGISVMTSPDNKVECLSFADLYALLGPESEGTKKWSDNSALGTELGSKFAPYPDAPLDISAPGTESGTYDSFIELVLADIAEERGQTESEIRTDFSGQSDDNVIIQGITGSKSSLGWVGFAFAEENIDSIKEIEISEEPGGECIKPSVESIADGSYPISRPLFIYVNAANAESNAALPLFVDHLLGDAYEESVTKAFGTTGYVALPDDIFGETKAAWEGR